jgi:microsomal dipeptidase-like Zn-dependent dipeptidase
MGLKHFGIEIVRYCNELGVLLDCSHAGERTSLDMIEMSEKPCIFSHSGAKALRDNLRNISDTQIKNCAAKGGVIGCPVFSDFVADTTGGHHPSPDDWGKHVDYVVNLVGIDHVGIGGDILAAPGGAVAWHKASAASSRDKLVNDFGPGFRTNHSHVTFLALVQHREARQRAGWVKIMGELAPHTGCKA